MSTNHDTIAFLGQVVPDLTWQTQEIIALDDASAHRLMRWRGRAGRRPAEGVGRRPQRSRGDEELHCRVDDLVLGQAGAIFAGGQQRGQQVASTGLSPRDVGPKERPPPTR